MRDDDETGESGASREAVPTPASKPGRSSCHQASGIEDGELAHLTVDPVGTDVRRRQGDRLTAIQAFTPAPRLFNDRDQCDEAQYGERMGK